MNRQRDHLRLSAKIITLLSIFMAGSAAADSLRFTSGDQQVAVIELFTSEGCSSCPPADVWLNKYTQNNDLWDKVIPLAFHVDYWDRLGWKDIFAKPAHTARQYRYKENRNIRSVYTPGFVVNGAEWRGWFKRKKPPLTQKPAGQLSINLENNSIRAHFQTNNPADQYQLNIAILGFGIHSTIKAGENDGKQFQHDFVVLGYTQQPSNNGQWKVDWPTLTPHTANRYALAAWVSDENNQAPIQATGGWLPTSYQPIVAK